MSNQEKIARLKSILASNTKTVETNNAYDEIFENCYLGDKTAALDIEKLKSLNFKYVLNAAQGTGNGKVDTDANLYKNDGISFLGYSLSDNNEQKILNLFTESTTFLHEGLSKNEKVYVHCVKGMGRSAIFVIAYLIMKKSMSLEEALSLVVKSRYVSINENFLQQLIDLENDTKK